MHFGYEIVNGHVLYTVHDVSFLLEPLTYIGVLMRYQIKVCSKARANICTETQYVQKHVVHNPDDVYVCVYVCVTLYTCVRLRLEITV